MNGIAGQIIARTSLPDDLHYGSSDVYTQRNSHPGALWVNRWAIRLDRQSFPPMFAATGGLTVTHLSGSDNSHIVLCGWIDNHKDIYSDLLRSGVPVRRGHQAEVALTALAAWGPTAALQKFRGAWALVWIDGEQERLVLARDPFGIRPLYLFAEPEGLYFASEIKSILLASRRRFQLNYRLVSVFLTQLLLDVDEETFFCGIKKVPPGSYVTVDLSKPTLDMKVIRYWEANPEVALVRDEFEVIERVRAAFLDSVRLQASTDGTVGVLLSGGLDSSAIVAAAIEAGYADRLRVFSAVSKDRRYDESEFIDRVAEYFSLEVTKVFTDLEPAFLLELLSEVTWLNDEPVASFSNVIYYLIMQKAAELGVPVLLSGQGADELLAGYRKYLGFYIKYLLREGEYLSAFKLLCDSMRRGTFVRQFSLAEAKRYLPLVGNCEPDIRGERLRKYASVDIGLGSHATVNQRQLEDLMRFSVPGLLHMEDRMSRGTLRELRFPFLDRRLVEILIPLDCRLKIRDGWSKWVFRKAIEPFLPADVTWRRDKQGFLTPQSEWLRVSLRPYLEKDYFAEGAELFRKGLVLRPVLMSKYAAYCKQTGFLNRVWFREIFAPLALEIWLRTFERYLQ